MPLQVVEPGGIAGALRRAIDEAFDDAVVAIEGGDGHFTIRVVSPAFAGKGRLARQRLVYSAIAPLMSGDSAPVHAVDRLETWTPDEAAAASPAAG